MNSDENTKGAKGCLLIGLLFAVLAAIPLIGFLIAFLQNPSGEDALENLLVGGTVFLILGVPGLLIARWAKRNPEAAARRMTGDIFGRSTEQMGMGAPPEDAEIIADGGSLDWKTLMKGVQTSPLPSIFALPKATGDLPKTSFTRIRECFEEQGLTSDYTSLNLSQTTFKASAGRIIMGIVIALVVYPPVSFVIGLIVGAISGVTGFEPGIGAITFVVIFSGSIAWGAMAKFLNAAKSDVDLPPFGQFAFLAGTKDKLFILPFIRKKLRFECNSVVQIDLDQVSYQVKPPGNKLSLTFEGSKRTLNLIWRKEKDWPEFENFSQYHGNDSSELS